MWRDFHPYRRGILTATLYERCPPVPDRSLESEHLRYASNDERMVATVPPFIVFTSVELGLHPKQVVQLAEEVIATKGFR
jgi:hypothetical protein